MYSPPRPLHLRIAFARLTDMVVLVLVWLAVLLLTFA